MLNLIGDSSLLGFVLLPLVFLMWGIFRYYFKGANMCDCRDKGRSPSNCKCTTYCDKLDVNWRHGHIASDGRDAKYVGVSQHNRECLCWKVGDTIFFTLVSGILGKLTITNKPAPGKWVNVYHLHGKYEEGLECGSEQGALLCKSTSSLCGKYVGTFNKA